MLQKERDLIPHQSALSTLVDAHVMSDDDMTDYYVCQAYRAVASVAADESALESGAAAASASHLPFDTMMDEMCRRAVTSRTALDTCAYLHCRFVYEQGSSYGEGNRVPCCTQSYPVLLARYAERTFSGQHRTRCGATAAREKPLSPSEHRTLLLGFAVLLRAVCERLVMEAAKTPGAFIVSGAPEFTRAVLRDVVPILAVHAEGLHDDLPAAAKLSAGASLSNSGSSSSPLPPSMVTVQCNTAVLVIACRILQDVCAADAYRPAAKPTSEGTNELHKTERRVVVILDTAVAPLLWEAVSAVRNAASRHVQWLQDAATLLRHQVKRDLGAAGDADAPGGGFAAAADAHALNVCLLAADRWQVRDVLRLFFDEFLAQQRKEYDVLDFRAHELQRAVGESARDIQALRDGGWACTLRTALVASAVAQGVIHSLWDSRDYSGQSIGGDKGNRQQQLQAVRGLQARLVGLVATYIQRALPRQYEATEPLRSCGRSGTAEDDSRASRFHSLVALMAAASATFFSCPMDLQQAQLWATDPALTQAVLQALMAHPIKSSDLIVVRLASLLSASILRSVCDGAAAVADVAGDDVIALLKRGSDGGGEAVSASSVDGASQAAVQLAILAIMAKPHVVLPRLFELLDDTTDATARSNALSVVVALPNMLADELKGLADSDATAEDGDGAAQHLSRSAQRALRLRQAKRARLEEALRGLAHHVLQRLGEDDVLTHRIQSASVFGLFALEDVIPALVRMLLKPDRSGRRGAAASALDAVLQRHQLRGVVGFLTCCAELLDERLGEALPPTAESASTMAALPRVAPATPGEIFLLSQLQGLSDVDVLSSDTSVRSSNAFAHEGNAADDSRSDSAGESPIRVTTRLRERLLQIVASVLTSVARRAVADQRKALGTLAANLLFALVRDVAACRNSCPNDSKVTDAREFRQQLVVRGATTFLAEVCKQIQQECSAAVQGGSSESSVATQIATGVLKACQAIWAQVDTEASDASSNHGEHHPSRTFVAVLVLSCLRCAPLHVCCGTSRPELQADGGDAAVWFFETIFAALLAQAATASAPASEMALLLARDEALQHLALSVLARFPPTFSLPRLERSFREKLCYDDDAALLVCPASALWTLSAEKKRHFRMLVFLLSHSIVDCNSWWARTTSSHADLALGATDGVVVSLATRLQATLWIALLAQPSLVSSEGRRVQSDDQKIAAAAMDFLALVLVAAVVSPSFAASVDSVAGVCLRDAASGDAGETDNLRASAHLALCVVRNSVKILAQQSVRHLGRQSFGLWHAGWVSRYLFDVIRLSNACATRGLRSNSSSSVDFAIATQCVEVVFTFVLSYRGAPAEQPETGAECSACTDPGRYLSPDDRAALVDFALGCLQFSACPALQLEAIKLSSALMAALPSVFTGDEGQARFQRLLLRLQPLSLIHPIPEARMLAENVVATLSSSLEAGQSSI